MTRKMNKLPVMEQFLTLQGEGYHTGRSAVFVRRKAGKAAVTAGA